jgi:hypothetical protein
MDCMVELTSDKVAPIVEERLKDLERIRPERALGMTARR